MFICGIVSFFHCCMHSEVMISLANSSIFSIQYDNFCILHVLVTKKFCFQVVLPIICTDQATTAPGWPNISLGPDGRPDRIDTTPITLTDSKNTICFDFRATIYFCRYVIFIDLWLFFMLPYFLKSLSLIIKK